VNIVAKLIFVKVKTKIFQVELAKINDSSQYISEAHPRYYSVGSTRVLLQGSSVQGV
jgi:hypothetical protein